MDSGNSSSMQSSSGDDDDDSKAESSMSMSMSMPMTMPTPMPMPLFLDHHALSLPSYYNLNNAFLPSSLIFENDYLPNAAYSSHPQLPQNLTTPSTHLNLDTFRSDPNCADQGGLPASSSSSRQNVAAPHGLGQVQQYQPSSSAVATTTNEPMKAVKNPRKRTRASRRAPTTVLTTDTSNFRAMVQEFTGFPAPPFSGSRKLDLFGSWSIFRTNPRAPDPLGHMNPLRPSAQMFQQPNLMADTGSANPNVDANSIIRNALMSTKAQMAANTIPAKDCNTLFTFPSLMDDHQDPFNTQTSGLLHRFGAEDDPLPQDHFGATWDGPQVRADTADGNERGKWFNDDGHSQASSQRVNRNGGCKMNYTAATGAASSSSDYNHRHNNDKGLEYMTTTTRDEGGAVDNWFGSSD